MMDLKIFTDNIDKKSLKQINTLLKQNVFKDCKVRIMPDVHADDTVDILKIIKPIYNFKATN